MIVTAACCCCFAKINTLAHKAGNSSSKNPKVSGILIRQQSDGGKPTSRYLLGGATTQGHFGGAHLCTAACGIATSHRLQGSK